MSPVKLILLLLVCAALPAVSPAGECVGCHTSSTFKVSHKAFYDHAEGFERSVHGRPGFTCAICHYGNPEAKEKDAAHLKMHRMENDRITEVCGKCHSGELTAFSRSRHTRETEGRRLATHCASCHGSMGMDIINVSRVIGRCRICHGGDDDAMLDLAGEMLSRSVAIVSYQDFVVSLSRDEELVLEITSAVDSLAAQWHRFDLNAVDAESAALLDMLRSAKDSMSGGE